MNRAEVSIASRIRSAQTPAEALRQILSRLEAGVGRIGYGDRAQAVEVLQLFDAAHELIDGISRGGGDLAPELVRLDTVKRQFRSKRRAFLKQLGGKETIADLRATRRPPDSHTWWFVDQQLAVDRNTRQRKTLGMVAVIAVALIALTILYQLFLAPDEATRLRFRHEQDAEQALSLGNLESALNSVELALSYAPEDGELLVTKGVTLELMNQPEEAAKVYAAARAALPDTASYYARRAQVYMVANQPELALEDANTMIELDPQSALAYYQRGNAYAALGKTATAIKDMETASQLADAAGETELQGMARVQMGNLMMMSGGPLDQPTAEP